MGTKKAKKLQALVDARAARNQELNKIAESQDRIAAALTLKSRIALFASGSSIWMWCVFNSINLPYIFIFA